MLCQRVLRCLLYQSAKVRTLIKQDFEQAFEQVDVLVCPTAPTTAFKAGENR
jgi:aspartyl-tRNA(Asn)/glutamyl-tRNA(Gln) amidotransferase subunit A